VGASFDRHAKLDFDLETLKNILICHLTRTPAMQVQDVYKLLHQAGLGSEHAAHDEQAARDWLEREITEMGVGPDDPLMDPVSPDGCIMRVHLRPYIATGEDPQVLLKAFIRTTNEWRGSKKTLKTYGQSACQFADEGLLPFSGKSLQSIFAEMEEQQFPAVHHSEVYKRLYRPAYRVVARLYLENK
jgi:hypothetical protein